MPNNYSSIIKEKKGGGVGRIEKGVVSPLSSVEYKARGIKVKE